MKVLHTSAGPVRGLIPKFGRIARGAAVAGAIKISGAALAFLMFLAVAAITDSHEFGLFGAAFAAASLISYFSTLGQQSVVLRFWPEYAGRNDAAGSEAFMALSIKVAAGGAVAGAAVPMALAVAILATPLASDWAPLCAATGLLTLGLSWSEFASAAMRARGAIAGALLPRDVVWRMLAIVVALAAQGVGLAVDAAQATFGLAVLLLLSVLPQTIALLGSTELRSSARLTHAQRRTFRDASRGLWGVNALPPALGQATTLVVAAILGAETAGAVFVIERTTRLVDIALSGLNQVLAPEISAAYHNGNRPHVQRIVSLAAAASTLVALAALVAFALFGELILSMFQASYATSVMVLVLLVFALAAAAESVAGPVEVLLQLTGGEHLLLRIVAVAHPLGLVAAALGAWLFGPLGAATAIAVTAVAWNAVAVLEARRLVGIDSTALGLMRPVAP